MHDFLCEPVEKLEGEQRGQPPPPPTSFRKGDCRKNLSKFLKFVVLLSNVLRLRRAQQKLAATPPFGLTPKLKLMPNYYF